DGMEPVSQRFRHAVYNPQKLIPVYQNGDALYVSAGGTLSNNTYTWFRFSSAKDTTVISGDSVFRPLKSGIYRVKVTNSVVTDLILHSELIHYTAPDQSI